MRLDLDEEQQDLFDVVDKFCLKESGPTEARTEDLASGALPGSWRGLLQLGLHAMSLPEDCGGGGAGLEDLAVVVEAAGRQLLTGPFVPTVVASSVVSCATPSTERDEVLAGFAEGAPGALVSGQVAARRHPGGDGWVLEGTTAPCIGAGAATTLVVQVDLEAETGWVVLPADTAGVVVTCETGADRSRDVARVVLDSVRVPDGALLGDLSTPQVEAVTVALWSAEAAGLMRWAVETAVAYAGVREQFGRPIGAFQAVKHKCARLLVRAELAAAAAWGAAVSSRQSADQQRLATGTARLVCLAQAPDAVLEAITVLGGVGFTWEHDAHLYQRRALALAATAGPVVDRRAELGEVAMTAQRRLAVDLPGEDPEFRAWVAGVLDEAEQVVADVDRDAYAVPETPSAYRLLLAREGLVVPHWPRPWGLAADAAQQVVISQELVGRDLPQPSTVIGEWAVPTVLAHGTEEQRERFVASTVTGETVWCQLFSEPGAGSDLASLTTRAVRVDGGWRLQGQKVWTSGAHEAGWGICLARTDPDAPKHRGLSFFLVDMHADGVDVRPIRQSTGDAHFNEVFLSEVFVPDRDLVGEPGQGWRIATTTLMNERTAIGSGMSQGAEVVVRDLVGSLGDAVSQQAALQALGEVTATSIAIGSLNLREVLKRVHGVAPGAGSSIAKVASADLARATAQALVELGAARGLLDEDPGVARHHLGVPAQLLGGGTVEIQLNVIAERVLGLPRA